jgi:uncharacterized membrane protein
MKLTSWRLGLAAVVLLALALRLYGLDSQSLWLNELDSWWVSQHDDVRVVLQRLAIEDLHPPGYQLLLYSTIHLFGDSEFLLRLPSVITGVLAVGMLGVLGRRLYDPFTGLVAAGLLAVFWAPLYYAQEARSYGSLMFAAIVSVYLALRLCERTEQAKPVSFGLRAALVLSLAITCYLHYFGLLLAGYVMLLLVYRLGLTRQVLAIGVATALLFVPWLPSMWQDLQVDDHWITTPGLAAIGSYLKFAFNRSAWVALGVALPLIALACLADGRRLLKFGPFSSNWRRDPTVLLLLWVLAPITVVLVKSLLSTPVVTDRNLIICLPPLYLLMARGLRLLPLAATSRRLLAVGLVGALMVQLVVMQRYYQVPSKEDFRAAVNYVVSHQQAVDAPLFGSRRAYYYDYYLARSGSGRRISAALTEPADFGTLEEQLKAHPEGKFWLLEGHFFPARPALRERLSEHYEVLDQARFYRSRATLYGPMMPDEASLQEARQPGV